MTAVAFKEACQNFAEAAAPYLPIRDDVRYEEALALIESLLEDDPLNAVIDVLSRAIESYENRNEALVAFEQGALVQPADLALLRWLMTQHELGTADPPEIGSNYPDTGGWRPSKSMTSK